MRDTSKVILSCALLSLAMACGGVETTPPDPPAEELDTSDGRTRAASGLTPELYGLGASWYGYEPTTHAVTPRELVYIIQRGEALTLFEITSYYNARGTSGFLSLRSITHDGAGWGDGVLEVSLEDNIKEELLCLDATTLARTPCERATFALRTAFRPLPEAGFAVKEPAIYPLTHHTDAPRDRVAISAIVAASIEEVERDVDALRATSALPNSSIDPDDSLVGWVQEEAGAPARQDIHLQVTANMMAAQWRVEEIVSGESTIDVTLSARCEPIKLPEQAPFGGEERRETFSLAADKPFDSMLIQLCAAGQREPAMASAQALAVPTPGLWPETKNFDVILEQVEGRVAVRVAPANLLYNHSLATGEEGADVIVPLPELFDGWEDVL